MLCNNVGYCTWYSGGPAACVIPSSYVLYFVGPEHGNGIIIPLMYCITYPPVSCPGLHSTLYLDVTHSCCSPVLHLVTPPLRYSGILYYLLPTALMYVVGCSIVFVVLCTPTPGIPHLVHTPVLSLSCIWEWIRLLFNSTS